MVPELQGVEAAAQVGAVESDEVGEGALVGAQILRQAHLVAGAVRRRCGGAQALGEGWMRVE